MNRQLTFRLFGIAVASLLFTVVSRNYYEHKVAELTADPQAFLAHLISLTQLGFGYRYFGVGLSSGRHMRGRGINCANRRPNCAVTAQE